MQSRLSIRPSLRDARYLMGTLVEIILYLDQRSDCPTNSAPIAEARHQDQLAAAMHAGFAQFEELERVCSIFDAESELSYLNRHGHERPIELSAQLFAIISLALDYTKKSRQYFSVLLAPLSQLWQQSAEANRLPGQFAIKTAQLLTDPEMVILDPPQQCVYFKLPGMKIDLGGFIKGYAVDRAREAIERAGIKSGFINAGNSSIAVWGQPAHQVDSDHQADSDHQTDSDHQNCWQLGIRHVADEEAILGLLSIDQTSISTSGTYERGFWLENSYYSHLIDRHRGYPVSDPRAVTVICRSATTAEVVSKLALLTGIRRAWEICDDQQWPISGLLHQQVDKSGRLRLKYSQDLPFILLKNC